MVSSEPRYIAVEGVIGVGKTTLVNALAERFSARCVFEQFEDNPFLADFYRDREAFGFSTQIFFLMSRFRQQEVLAQGDLFARHTLSDYFFEKDRVFAQLNLSGPELTLYDRLFEVLRVQVPQPDFIVYLRADLDAVLERIRARGRPYELDMDPGYIAEVAAAYSEFFSSYKRCRTLTVDTTALDLRHDERALDRIEAAVRTCATRVDGIAPERPAQVEMPWQLLA